MVVGGVEQLGLAAGVKRLERVERLGLRPDEIGDRLRNDLAGRLVLGLGK
jgi:hypothetical protein